MRVVINVFVVLSSLKKKKKDPQPLYLVTVVDK